MPLNLTRFDLRLLATSVQWQLALRASPDHQRMRAWAPRVEHQHLLETLLSALVEPSPQVLQELFDGYDPGTFSRWRSGDEPIPDGRLRAATKVALRNGLIPSPIAEHIECTLLTLREGHSIARVSWKRVSRLIRSGGLEEETLLFTWYGEGAPSCSLTETRVRSPGERDMDVVGVVDGARLPFPHELSKTTTRPVWLGINGVHFLCSVWIDALVQGRHASLILAARAFEPNPATMLGYMGQLHPLTWDELDTDVAAARYAPPYPAISTP